MAKNQTKSVDANALKADADALAALANMEDYAPANANLTVAKVRTASQALQAAADTFAQAEADWQTARDAHVAMQWAFHNAMIGAKQQVVAQYGDDSDQAQAVGLKKKSERKSPRRAKSATTSVAAK